jgi:hypothetical protein
MVRVGGRGRTLGMMPYLPKMAAAMTLSGLFGQDMGA